MKIVYIGFAFKHHKNTHAGYHRIKEYLKYDYFINCQWEFDLAEYDGKNIFVKLFRRLYFSILGSGTPFAVLKCIILSLTKNDLVFHFIYAENTYKWLHKFKRNNKIICTFHQPLSYFENNPEWDLKLKRIDGIILMSSNEMEYFKAKAINAQVLFIPHGIDVNFYKPSLGIKKEKSILMVGSWLRDFEFAKLIFTEIVKMDKHIQITIVSNVMNHDLFDGLLNVTFLSGISDEELRELYYKSGVVFLPLISYTANNALLEACSVNSNIVIATNSINDSYIDSTKLSILPLEEDTVCDNIMSILKSLDNSSRNDLHEYVTRKFSWDHIANVTLSYFISMSSKK